MKLALLYEFLCGLKFLGGPSRYTKILREEKSYVRGQEFAVRKEEIFESV
jgi:hypothetical protein